MQRTMLHTQYILKNYFLINKTGENSNWASVNQGASGQPASLVEVWRLWVRWALCVVGVFSELVTVKLVLKEEEQFIGWRRWTGLPAKGMACAEAQRPGLQDARYGQAKRRSDLLLYARGLSRGLARGGRGRCTGEGEQP